MARSLGCIKQSVAIVRVVLINSIVIVEGTQSGVGIFMC